MNCNSFENYIDDYLDDTLASHQAAALNDHLANCDSCAQRLKKENQFRQTLVDYQAKELAPSTAARLLREAVAHKAQETQHSGFIKGFATAAVLAIVMVIGFNHQNIQKADAPQVSMYLGETKMVNLVFNTPESFENATISMRVSKHFLIEGYGKTRELSWQTTLKKGQNYLALPLIPLEVKSGELMAVIKYHDKERIFKVKLEVKPDRTVSAVPYDMPVNEILSQEVS